MTGHTINSNVPEENGGSIARCSSEETLDISETEQTNFKLSQNPFERKCLLAIPKKGRMQPHCLELLAACGMPFVRNSREDIAYVSNLPIVLVFLNSVDIPTFVGQGNVDIGITGDDVLKESGEDVSILSKLAFGKCKLALQGPKDCRNVASDAVGSSIVTSFPRITLEYIQKIAAESGKTNLVDSTSIRVVTGSVEASCKLGLGNFVVDLIETGETMRAAGLECIDTVMETEAILIGNPGSKQKKLIDRIARRISGYLNAKQYVLLTYNVSSENLEDAIAINRGRRGPSITKLTDPDWYSISVMVLKSQVHTAMDLLQSLGAQDIFVLEINNARD